jgi:hypothetical protein
LYETSAGMAVVVGRAGGAGRVWSVVDGDTAERLEADGGGEIPEGGERGGAVDNIGVTINEDGNCGNVGGNEVGGGR